MNALITYFMAFSMLLLATNVHAEAPAFRTWTSTAGSTLEAKLIADDANGVTLEREDGSQITVQRRQLSPADREYLDNRPEPKGATEIPGINAKPGQYSQKIACVSDDSWHYFVYLPEDFHMDKQWPVWFIFSPSGGWEPNRMDRYRKGAELLNAIVVLSVESRNGFDDYERAAETMIEDVFDRFPVNKELSFTSGFSGGSRCAFLMAEAFRDVAGVLACGSGNGVYAEDGFRDAKLRNSIYVYSLMGATCFNRSESAKDHDTYKNSFRLRFFAGKHDWAPADLITEGMARVYGEALMRYRKNDAETYQRQYLKNVWPMVEAFETTQPWEAFMWAEFLKAFRVDSPVTQKADDLYHKLKNDPMVEMGLKAEEEILDFSEKHFAKTHFRADRQPDSRRKKEAERLAERFALLPHAEILRMLGDAAQSP